MANVFFHLMILLVSPSAFCAMEHGDIVNVTTINPLVNLTCHLNSSQNVEWSVYSGMNSYQSFPVLAINAAE